MNNVLLEIKELDGNLSLLREGWQTAPESRKAKWMDGINSLLDKRLELMAIRDGKGTEVTP